jgi:ribosomal protein S18 acetylase RimI-like enzyme
MRATPLKCLYCRNTAVYKCGSCGALVCEAHAREIVVCPSCTSKSETKHAVREVSSKKEKDEIRELVKQFWGEAEQLTFDTRFNVSEQRAYVAKAGKKLAGFISLAEKQDSLIVVALGIRPQYQGSGIGRSLIKKAELEARRLRKKKLLVSTSNDDLPALAFYQSFGFQIFEVAPNVIAEKHGRILAGICGLPVRDELRLQKTLE